MTAHTLTNTAECTGGHPTQRTPKTNTILMHVHTSLQLQTSNTLHDSFPPSLLDSIGSAAPNTDPPSIKCSPDTLVRTHAAWNKEKEFNIDTLIHVKVDRCFDNGYTVYFSPDPFSLPLFITFSTFLMA